MFLAGIDWLLLGQTAGAFIVGIGIGIIPKIISMLKGKKIEKKAYKSVFDIKEVAEDDLKMQDILTELRMIYDCDRAFAYLFHNGGAYLDGSPMKKMSMLYESVRRGVSYEAANSRDICVSTVPALTDIISSNRSQIIQIADMKDNFFKHLLESRNVNVSAYCPLKKGLQIIGFIGIHYCKGSNTHGECSQDLAMLEQYASTVEVCLMDRFKYEEQK